MGLEICKCKVTQQSTELQIDAHFPPFFCSISWQKNHKKCLTLWMLCAHSKMGKTHTKFYLITNSLRTKRL